MIICWLTIRAIPDCQAKVAKAAPHEDTGSIGPMKYFKYWLDRDRILSDRTIKEYCDDNLAAKTRKDQVKSHDRLRTTLHVVR
jgi:hypothetical protein